MGKTPPPVSELFNRRDPEDETPEMTPERLRWKAAAEGGRLSIDFKRPIYEDLLIPYGALPVDIRAHACWNYYVKAMKAVQKVGKGIDDQILYDDQPWRDLHFREQALAVASQYGLESPEEMFKFWDYVDKQADLLGIPRAHDNIRKAINP